MNNSQCLPLVSFCILTYNQEKFIEDAIKGALSQEYDNLEIIISDDGSTDRTYDIAKNLIDNYKGPHKVILNRNNPNLGIREHCNKLLYELAKGEYILLAAGDDISAPERTKEYVNLFEEFPQVTSISCKSLEVDEKLQAINERDEFDGSYSIYTIDDYISFKDFLIKSGDSRGLRRCVIEKFPPLQYPKAEDLYLFIRSFLVGSVCYIRKPLVLRRHHNNNVSSQKTDRNSLESLKKQIDVDIEYAKSKNYITEYIYKMMKQKAKKIYNISMYTFTSIFYSPKVFIYRVARKLYHQFF